MLQDEKQKVFSLEGAISSFTGFAFNILKGDLAILISAPRFFGFKPKSLSVLAAQENKIE